MNPPKNKEKDIATGYIDTKAIYKIPPTKLVDINTLNFIDEVRTYYEIFTILGSAFLGAVLSRYNIYLLITCVVFISFGVFNFIRYRLKIKKVKNFVIKSE